jgi:hypothetical protein
MLQNKCDIIRCVTFALDECVRLEVRAMNENEALIRRRELLFERISMMNNEVEKIDQRIAFLQTAEASGLVDLFQTSERLAEEVS